MGAGRKAIPPELKDNSIYKDAGVIERQKEETPKIKSAKLTPPSLLTKDAQKEWRRIVKLYKELNIEILNDLDKQTLASYCMEVDIRDRLYKQWTQEQKAKVLVVDQTKSASVFKTGSGQISQQIGGQSEREIVNPILREINKHNATIRVLAEQLALTPTGRAAIAVRREKSNRSAAEQFMDDE